MLLLTLMLACDPTTPDDTQPQDTDTGSDTGLDQDALDGLKSWENTPIKTVFVFKSIAAPEPDSEEGDTLVVFVPLENAELPDLDFVWDIALTSDGDAAAKAQDHNASRSNTSSVMGGGADTDNGHLTVLKAAELAWDQGEPCLGTLEECMSLGSPTELNMSLIDSSAYAFDLQFAHTFKTTEDHRGALMITKRIDKSTPLMASGSSHQGGWHIAGDALVRFQVYDQGTLVASHGPYQDWEEILRILDAPIANSVSATLVEGGMLLAMTWDTGGGEHEVSWESNRTAAWDEPTQTERYWMDQWEPQGAQFGPELKSLRVGWLGFMSSTRQGDIEITSTLQSTYGSHTRLVPLSLELPIDREGNLPVVEMTLDGEDCSAGCASTEQSARAVTLRKRPGALRTETRWGTAGGTLSGAGSSAGTATGQVAYTQSGQTMTLTYMTDSAEVVFESDTGECRVCLGAVDSMDCSAFVLKCGAAYSLDASLPVAFETSTDGKQYHEGLVF